MTATELIKILETVPPDTPVVVGSSNPEHHHLVVDVARAELLEMEPGEQVCVDMMDRTKYRKSGWMYNPDGDLVVHIQS